MPEQNAFLDSIHPDFPAIDERCKREERRLAGGDAVLDELTRFLGENEESYKRRQGTALYVNLPRQHVQNIVGHISRVRPLPGGKLNLGSIGEIRERSLVDPAKSPLGEQLWYNLNGQGQDGQSWPSYFDSVHERVLATGYRWIVVEAPVATPEDNSDVAAGMRPFPVEYSPRQVPFWHFRRGQLNLAIIRIVMDELRLDDGKLIGAGNEAGYYLLVRKGVEALGSTYANGGWWMFDPDKNLINGMEGDWSRTKGQIPMFPFYGRIDPGTLERPTLASSLTMELGQASCLVMDLGSARVYDALDAAASNLFFMGANQGVMGELREQVLAHNRWFGVPPVESSNGTGQDRIVSVFDGSTGTVPAAVFTTILDGTVNFAREIMLRQLVEAPNASGVSKQADFAQSSVPLLVQLAATRAQAESNFAYFAALRAGVTPDAFIDWPTDFDLRSVEESVDAMLTTLRLTDLRSATLESKLILLKADEAGFIENDDERKAIAKELAESADANARAASQSQALDAVFAGGLDAVGAPQDVAA